MQQLRSHAATADNSARAVAPAADPAPDEGPPDAELHEIAQCLTAIRYYMAGARRALAGSDADRVRYALSAIEQQVVRAHSVLAARCRRGGMQ